MANKNNVFELSDFTDNLGTAYLTILFFSGVIWAFIAVNNFETPDLFKIALIYSLLLVFGFLGVTMDRGRDNLGFDSRLWEGTNIRKKLLISVVLLALWYLVFMAGGFSIATAQSVTAGGALFSLSPALNFFLVSFLGPIAENIFFFGVLNLTVIFALRRMLVEHRNRTSPIVLAAIPLLFMPLFSHIPNSMLIMGLSSVLILVTGFFKNKLVERHGPIIISALLIGGITFPAFHNFAYQLNQSNFLAAQIFGILVCILAAYIGMMPVDILHIGNNAAVALGLAG